jgi:hypothetical protein
VEPIKGKGKEGRERKGKEREKKEKENEKGEGIEKEGDSNKCRTSIDFRYPLISRLETLWF